MATRRRRTIKADDSAEITPEVFDRVLNTVRSTGADHAAWKAEGISVSVYEAFTASNKAARVALAKAQADYELGLHGAVMENPKLITWAKWRLRTMVPEKYPSDKQLDLKFSGSLTQKHEGNVALDIPDDVLYNMARRALQDQACFGDGDTDSGQDSS